MLRLFSSARTLGGLLGLLSPGEKWVLGALVVAKMMLQLVDLLGLVTLGLVIREISGSNPSPMNFPLVGSDFFEKGITPAQLTAIIAVLFSLKSIASASLTSKTLQFLAKVEGSRSSLILRHIFPRFDRAPDQSSRGEIQWAYIGSSHRAFQWFLFSSSVVISEGFLAMVVLFGMVVTSPTAGIFAVAFFGLVGITYHYAVGRKLDGLGENIAYLHQDLNDRVIDLWAVHQEARALGREEAMLHLSGVKRLRLAKVLASQRFLVGVPRLLIEAVALSGLGLLLLAGSQFYSGENLAVVAAVFLVGGLRLLTALAPLQSALSDLRSLAPQCAAAVSVLRDEPARAGEALLRRPSLDGETAEDEPIPSLSAERLILRIVGHQSRGLEPINLHLAANSITTIAGTSGVGKTTLLRTLSGLMEPMEGQVKIGGRPARIFMASRPGKLGFVPQQPALLKGTLRDNITLFQEDEEVDFAHLSKIIEECNLGDIAGHGEGLYRLLSPDTNSLSGGQIQRIAIARALYGRPKILFLDEPTSGLDGFNEGAVLEVISQARMRMTIVLATHKRSTARISQQILVLDGHQRLYSFPSLEEVDNLRPGVLT